MRATEVAPAFEWRSGPAGRMLVCAPLEALARHLFSTRDLRLRGDDVAREQRGVAAALGVDPANVFSVTQVHGRRVALATEDDAVPAGSEADAIVTVRAWSAASVLIADCVPVLIGDQRRRAVAAVHAGWRGTAAGIVAATVDTLRSVGVRASDLVVAIGPSIGPCCYQVDAPVRQAFAAAGADTEAWFDPDGPDHWRLDLWRATSDQLRHAGVPMDAIHVAGVCTADHPAHCWSYRRDGPATGRLIAGISLRSQTP